jgi:hypothetical protein
VTVRGRPRFVGGWSTAGVAQWLLDKKFDSDGKYTSISAVAVTGYGRDSPTNRHKVRRNLRPLRSWLADRTEFLLQQHGHHNTTIGLKVYNPGNENDRVAAHEQLARLEARGEVTIAEAERWHQMLFLGQVAASE